MSANPFIALITRFWNSKGAELFEAGPALMTLPRWLVKPSTECTGEENWYKLAIEGYLQLVYWDWSEA